MNQAAMNQYALWVEFELQPQHLAAFREAVLHNARASVAHEPGCLRFDVLDILPGAPTVFLYEIYTDEAAFKAHLATPHFLAFDARTAPMIARKSVRFGSVTQIAKP
jgi:(4S)-4-hydroxy-5-phosphonooxypentane-2,3-dione isomerase